VPPIGPPAAALSGEAARAAVASYLAELATQRRLSGHTVSNYRRDLERLLDLAGERALESLGVQDIRRFVARLHGGGLSGRSIARSLSAWRGLYRWLARRHGVEVSPCEALRAPKGPRALPATLSPDQAARLLDGGAEDVLELRDKAMFELFYSSGLRLAELAGLNLRGGLDLESGMVEVLGKRRKQRSVPVGAQARTALAAWLEQRAALAAPGEAALFVSRRGTRLSMRMIQVRLRRWAARHGLDLRVHPHVLRHSFASHVLQSSGDLRAVQEMLGHASISSTQVYTHLDFQHLAKVYDAAHPRAKKK
jgi:integrase/recombinase XerC